MTRNYTLQLSQAERSALERPGHALGRSETEEQCRLLRESAQQLRGYAARRESALGEKRRVWYTLSLTGALLAVVMLI